jgi:hypothetical protein
LPDRVKLRSCERPEARRGRILDVFDRGATKGRDANPRFHDGRQTVRRSRGLAMVGNSALAKCHVLPVLCCCLLATIQRNRAVTGSYPLARSTAEFRVPRLQAGKLSRLWRAVLPPFTQGIEQPTASTKLAGVPEVEALRLARARGAYLCRGRPCGRSNFARSGRPFGALIWEP